MGFVRFIAFSVVRAWQGFWRNAMMSLALSSLMQLTGGGLGGTPGNGS